MIFFRKLRAYGLRRASIYVIVVVVCRVRVIFYRLFFSDNSPRIENSRVLQPTQFVGKGQIIIKGARLGVWPSPFLFGQIGYIEARSLDAQVEINSSTFLNNAFVIIADKAQIIIGERCLIGPNFFISDSDFHGLELENRGNGRYECGKVIIEDDVFIGDNVRILKSVNVGRGSVIGSGSVVVSDVEPMSVYAGVPAKKIRDI